MSLGEDARQDVLRSMATEAIILGQHSNSVSSLNNPMIWGRDGHGPSSKPCRRLFILLLLFDAIFSGLFWIFTLIVSGGDLIGKILSSIEEYNIKTSMFDTLILSVTRLIMGGIFYGICSLKLRFPIALTTAASSAFLIAKVIIFQWSLVNAVMFNIALVSISFFLTWVEHWYLDIRVIPSELNKSPFIFYAPDERTPLVHPSSTERVSRYLNTPYQPSCYSFYSPLQSPNDSGDEDEDGLLGEVEDDETGVRIPRKLRRKKPLTLEDHQYIQMGKETLSKAWEILNASGWNLEKRRNEDTVHCMSSKGHKIFKLRGKVHLPPKLLLEELYFRFEHIPSWNPSLKECRSLQVIDAHTDVSYQVSAEAAGGLVSVRDFVTLRHWDLIEGGRVFASSGVSIQHPLMPEQKGCVRGENGVGGWFMSPVEGQPEICDFQWLLDSDIKGWFPGSVVDGAMCKVQFDYLTYLRKHADLLIANGTVDKWKNR
eukprot:TRINITY_DN3887_c0_g2_i2.p1 TRINITY_DN3887_c0_g2~~TRINITY_DN3887_c0_g2_i2.p1  ORF type:complete len:485 (+),score=128.30 TRINITY_DN3887_c0_g2_i2:163-1617(+)